MGRLGEQLERNFHGLLELLAEGNATATCFVVGYFAEALSAACSRSGRRRL